MDSSRSYAKLVLVKLVFGRCFFGRGKTSAIGGRMQSRDFNWSSRQSAKFVSKPSGPFRVLRVFRG